MARTDRLQRIYLRENRNPKFGSIALIWDNLGLGIEIGEPPNDFTVRAIDPNSVQIEATTEIARSNARNFFAKFSAMRASHRT